MLMIKKRGAISALAGLVVFLAPAHAQNEGGQPSPLTLDEAVALAISQEEPSLARFESRADAKENLAIADSQLSDPKISAMAQNFPVDSFNFSQEPMTQIRLGLRQELPNGQSLRVKREKRQAEAALERMKREVRAFDIALQVRLAWLNRYEAEQEILLTREARKAVNDLIDALGASFAQGKLISADVFRAELELSLLDDRIQSLQQVRDRANAELARYIGAAVQRPFPNNLSNEGKAPSLALMEQALVRHPKVRALDAGIAIEQSGVELARQAYRPSWAIEGGYGMRADNRPDFVSVGVSLSVPLFTGNRQDKRLTAARQMRNAKRLDRDALLLDLKRTLYRTYEDWTRYGDRIALYDQSVVMRAEETAEASLNAYAGGQADFPELIRSQLAELDAETKRLRLTVERAKARAVLTFLYGDPS